MKLILLLASVALASAFCPADTIYDSIMQRCYQFASYKAGFQQAQEACVSRGGLLVNIHNATENFYLSETAKQVFPNSPFWIGLSNLGSNSWYWSDGSRVSFSVWANNEPGNNTNACAYSTATGQWYHTSCANGLPFICSFDPNPPTTTKAPTTHGPKCPAEHVYFSKTNACYYVGTSAVFWGAENMCVALKGHLTSIHSVEENNFVMSLTSIGGTRKADEMTWIGLHFTGRDWIWNDGTEVTYRNWEPGMPSDTRSDQCVELLQDDYSKKKNVKGTWNNQPCSWTMRKYVCKVPALW